MNASIDFSSDNKTCEGKCIIEMQKTLEPSVIMEYFEVVRDFHNDDKTATKLKNIILSETSEAVKLLNERASEMILMVDEIFLNRRQRQSSFYHLCHKLARTALPEGTKLPDESKCVCFSEENLRKFYVDPGANSSLDFSSNLASIKGALKQYFGELRCTDCGKFMQLCRSGNTMNSMSDCSCSGPSVTSQHKVHEAILELNKAKDDKMHHNSWYFTQLKRDADYYMKRCRSSDSTSSDESVNSFEIISCSNQVNYLDNDKMDNESLGSDLNIQDKMLIDCSNKLVEPQQNPKGNFSPARHQQTLNSVSDIQNLSQNLNNKLMHAFSFAANLTDSSKSNTDTHSTASDECKAKNVNMREKRSNPAAILKQSFSPYFNQQASNQSTAKNDLLKAAVCPAECLRRKLQKLSFDSESTEFCYFNRCNQEASNQSTVSNDFLKTTVCPAECLKRKLQRVHVDSESTESRVKNKPAKKSAKAINLKNEREANPSDSLKCALNSYLKNKASENWLRN